MLVLFQFWVLLVAVVSFFILLFPPVLLVSFLPFRPRLRCVQFFWNIFSHILLQVGCFCKLTTIDRRNPEDKTFPLKGVYIANHQSYLDIPLLITQFQIPPIMKKEVLYIPFFGLIGWASGSLIVTRGKRDSRKKVFELTRKRLLDEGMAIQYYPEGTRSKDAIVKTYSGIKVTLLQLAYEENLPVVACSIKGTRNAFEKQGKVRPFQKLGVIVHPKILKKENETIQAFCQRCWAQVEVGCKELDSIIS